MPSRRFLGQSMRLNIIFENVHRTYLGQWIDPGDDLGFIRLKKANRSRNKELLMFHDLV